MASRFKKGQIPWNKGKKGIHLSPDSEFKKGGLVGKEHPSYVDGVQRMTVDCVHLYTGNGTSVRRPRHAYKEHYGSIPKGFVIVHLDGDKNNDSIDNLEAISRAENMRRNSKNR